MNWPACGCYRPLEQALEMSSTCGHLLSKFLHNKDVRLKPVAKAYSLSEKMLSKIVSIISSHKRFTVDCICSSRL